MEQEMYRFMQEVRSGTRNQIIEELQTTSIKERSWPKLHKLQRGLFTAAFAQTNAVRYNIIYLFGF